MYHVIRHSFSKGSPTEALIFHLQLYRQGTCFINELPLILKACTSLSMTNHGMALHAYAIKCGVHLDVMIGTSLVSMYAKCGSIDNARKVFVEMPQRNVVTYNALISGCLACKDCEYAMYLFGSMPERTVVTWNEMIRGFAKMGDTKMARKLFDKVPFEMRTVVTWTVMVDGYSSNGEMEAAKDVFEMMPRRNCFVWSVMVSGYCRIGDVEKARDIFGRCSERNLVVWNSLISGFARNGFCEEAIEAYREMQVEGFEPDEVTVTSVLSVCSQLGLLDVGKEIHFMICEKQIRRNQFVLNGLVDMYAKCGDLDTARSVFDGMSEKNGACWNSMISGYAIHGKCHEAVEFFQEMECSGVNPDEISFLTVLSACAHGGLVNEGLDIFSRMAKYGVSANVKHYGCIIDLLARAARLKEAFDVAKSMPMRPNDTIWGSLLGAFRLHSEAALAEEVLQNISIRNSERGSHYVALSNIYAAANRWEKAEDIRTTMVEKGLQKVPGSSSLTL